MPVEGHAPSAPRAGELPATLALKVESCFSTCFDPHELQAVVAAALVGNASKVLPRFWHVYSNIGIKFLLASGVYRKFSDDWKSKRRLNRIARSADCNRRPPGF
jgi:hypothetical protein